jgi:hypothetical protein
MAPARDRRQHVELERHRRPGGETATGVPDWAKRPGGSPFHFAGHTRGFLGPEGSAHGVRRDEVFNGGRLGPAATKIARPCSRPECALRR